MFNSLDPTPLVVQGYTHVRPKGILDTPSVRLICDV